MKLQVAPYNNTAGTWTEAEETAVLHYELTHGFNGAAEAIITLSDPIGLIAQKYANSSGAVGGAVADDGGAETDETTEANSDYDLMDLLRALHDLFTWAKGY